MSFNIISPGGILNMGGTSSLLNVPLGTAVESAVAAVAPALLGAAGQYFSAFSIDVVGVYDDSFNQLIQSARPMRATVTPMAKVMEHPVESGGVVTDWRVTMPIEIMMTVFASGFDYRATYASIASLYASNQLFTIQTKSGVYPNMVLAGIPHEEDPEQYDMLAIGLRFKEAILVTAQFQALTPAQASTTDQSTISRGEQPKTSVLFDLGNAAGLFK